MNYKQPYFRPFNTTCIKVITSESVQTSEQQHKPLLPIRRFISPHPIADMIGHYFLFLVGLCSRSALAAIPPEEMAALNQRYGAGMLTAVAQAANVTGEAFDFILLKEECQPIRH